MVSKTKRVQNGVAGGSNNPYEVKLSLRFFLGSILGVSAMAFAVGRLATMLFLENHVMTINQAMTESSGPRALPPPFYPEKEEGIPQSVYSSKQFNTGTVSTSEHQLARRANVGTTVGVDRTPVNQAHENSSSTEEDEQGEDEEEVHEPAGQHLLVDIKSVDGVFLNSEERLAQAMVDLINMSGLTMLSYHCHGLEPVGVSCVGVLLESHVSFHTWPIPGVITLDLFTCGPSPLLPLLPVIEKLFGVPRWSAVPGEVIEKPHVQWSHKKRGFRQDNRNPEDVDMDHFLLGWPEYDAKTHVATATTPFQNIDIFEVINSRWISPGSYKRSLSNDDSYESKNPELFKPDRVVYLDGIMQSRLRGEAAYHEALVHPAMITHSNPKRVAIIGGGEGATLREVLKHKTVEMVTMVEIDEMMVQLSREHLPDWSNCSSLIGSAPSCFDDPRAEVFYTDAIAWFIERFENKDKFDPSYMYDIIIMDALDPSSVVEFSDILYDNDALMRSLSNALGDKGIFIAQFGEDDDLTDPPAQYSKKNTETNFINHLKKQGFTMVTEYVEGHGGFLGVWCFLIALKDDDTKVRWYRNQAGIDFEMRGRLLETVSGESSLLYFDGAAMMSYQYPSRIHEEVFCRDEPTTELCEHEHGFDPERPNTPISAFEVKHSSISGAGLGLFLKEDVPKGSYVAIDETVHDVLVMPETVWWINLFRKAVVSNRWNVFDSYSHGYGFGGPPYSVECLMKFMNHGCDGGHNLESMLQPISITEMTADPKKMPDEHLKCPIETFVYSPYIQRNHLMFQNSAQIARRDLNAGEELLGCYLGKFNQENWERGVWDLRAQCSSPKSHVVSDYEAKSK